MSLNLLFAVGYKISISPTTFSCLSALSSFISLSIRFASITLSNAFPIFLIATFSPVTVSLAEHTIP